MVRYAHKRAVEMGLDIHFAQRLAEDTKFPDNYFDIVHAFIMFHEVPLQNQEAVIREAHRVLRPGGTFLVCDFLTSTEERSPLSEIYGFTDGKDNCEPYARDFTSSDFHGTIEKVFGPGHLDLSQLQPKGGFVLPLRIATK
jgi:ubiquinone/menaquinone biosynthesis C-methylase UbiE